MECDRDKSIVTGCAVLKISMKPYKADENLQNLTDLNNSIYGSMSNLCGGTNVL